MKQTHTKFSIQAILLFFFIFLTSCNKHKEASPFPYAENEYAQPKTKSFEFPKPDTLQWVTTKLKKLPIKKFSWDKIPSKPFDIGIPYKSKAPLTTKPFDFESLPSTPFSLDSLPKKDLIIKVSVLGAPKIVKAGSPVVSPQSSRGVMSIDANFGLPGTVNGSIKDKDGMIWFATGSGIARYDSENIKIYEIKQGLDSDLAYSLFQDSKGRLWLAGRSNIISVIDFEANLIYKITSANDFGNVYGINEDNKGNIWYNNDRKGYNIVNLEKKWSKQFNLKTGLLDANTITVYQDKEGLIWLSSNRGVNVLDLKAGKNITLTQDQGLMNNFVASFYEDRAGKMWIAGGGGFNILNNDKTEISYFADKQGLDGLQQGAGSEVFQDKNGIYYLT